MKIKHWQGYGTVDAKKVTFRTDGRKVFMNVLVKGNHEWGLVREDKYDLKRWLIDRFDKGAKDVNPYSIEYTYFEKDENGTDTVLYSFAYNKEA